MIEDLKRLLVVQEKDVEIIRLEGQLGTQPKMLDDLKNSLGDKTKELEAAKTFLKDLQVSHKKMEIELESKLTTQRKYETQLLTIKTNQEYKALEKEIFNVKTESSRVEDIIIEKMLGIDTQLGSIKRIEAELNEQKQICAQREQEIKNHLKDLEEKHQTRIAERDLLIKDIEPGLFRRYKRILEHLQGEALVPIVDHSCQGCHTLLPPQVFVDVRRNIKLITCDNCSRLLYISERVTPTENMEPVQ